MDILNIIVNSKWQTQQVGYHYTRIDPINPATGLGRIYEMKASSGWPEDVNQYDANYIYFFVTEDDAPNRNDPSCYKMQVGIAGKGMVVLPRNMTALPWINYNRRIGISGTPRRRQGEERRKNPQSPNADTGYNHVVKCGSPQTRNLNAEFEVFDGPFLISWGGDIGDCQTYVLTRVYNAGQSRERYYFAVRPDGTSYGWVGWDVASLVGGIFVVGSGDTSYRNTLVNADPPAFPNPCKY